MTAKTLLAAGALLISLQGVAEASTLSLGDKGAEVKTLQQTLKSKGYFTYNNITGYYGSVTKESVRKFQRASHLQADGIAGPKTQAALYGAAASKSTSMATLRYGARGAAVSSVQSRLKQLGYYTGKIDGIYKGGTQSAVKKFQQAARLSADGVVGPKTRGHCSAPKRSRLRKQKSEPCSLPQSRQAAADAALLILLTALSVFRTAGEVHPRPVLIARATFSMCIGHMA